MLEWLASSVLAVLVAWLIDLWLGEPSPRWHPVVWIGHYLQRAGYTIIPVNPAYEEVLGQKCYPNLHEVPVKIDLVDVFRKPAEVMAVVDEAIAVGAGSVWLQLGVIAPDAADKAAAAGLKVVSDRCTKIEHRRLIG